MTEQEVADSRPVVTRTMPAAVQNTGLYAWLKLVRELWELALLSGVVASALFSISEIGTRETITARVSAQLEQARADTAGAVATLELKRQATRTARAESASQPQQLQAASANPLVALALEDESAAYDAAENARDRVVALAAAETSLANAAAMGIGAKEQTLREVVARLQSRLAEIEEREVAQAGLETQSGEAPSNEGESADNSNASIVRELMLLPFERLRNEHLLAIAVVSSAVLGSLLAAVRRKNTPTIRTLTVGAATGFIVFVAIKGGRYVFLMQLQGDVVAFNPYGTAFAGLIAGLFSETAYGVLSALVTDLAERIKRAVASASSDAPAVDRVQPTQEPRAQGVRLNRLVDE